MSFPQLLKWPILWSVDDDIIWSLNSQYESTRSNKSAELKVQRFASANATNLENLQLVQPSSQDQTRACGEFW
ncbi:hypothetical protein SeLEV6574_g06417 [Synchytrium endobioticum]|uniref:Uncharacterized protein n=1 Tax=Synchytrium endobioticum TaxID=286115 RepID=A0A507CNR4_9FUNG|nr:hypothetical protein SeLEV6574_g06417 [Synchytrium endobioticum]